ncbi:hypothetical protein QTQ03_07710 [Micromonospora sp. WMMA1363]|nr:hypothetical protein [Micromonospora sp. WMMA1363]MDM4719489.1 hypothetical protein [Micromonospora sp. WMMA1363]
MIVSPPAAVADPATAGVGWAPPPVTVTVKAPVLLDSESHAVTRTR